MKKCTISIFSLLLSFLFIAGCNRADQRESLAQADLNSAQVTVPMDANPTNPVDDVAAPAPVEPAAPAEMHLVPYYPRVMMELYIPCTTSAKGIFVSGTASDDGDGSYEKPFKNINDALAKARTTNLDVCVSAGEYDLGNGSLKLGMKDRLFGSVNLDGSAPTRSATQDTKIFNDGSLPVVQFLSTADRSTTLDGFWIKRSSMSTTYTSQPLVAVRGGSPTISHNLIEARTVPAGEMLKSIGISVSTDEANVDEVTIAGNTIKIADNQSGLGATIGILVQNLRDGTVLNATIRYNQIQVGTAQRLSAGILAYGETVGAVTTAKVQKNTVSYAEAFYTGRRSVGEDQPRQGGLSLGIALGLGLNTDGVSDKIITKAELTQNRVISSATRPSYESTGIYLTSLVRDAMDTVLVANNAVQSGPSNRRSSAINVMRPSVKIYHNTLRAGEESVVSNDPIPRACDICASGGGTTFSGKYASVVEADGDLSGSLELVDNILLAKKGEGDVFGIFLKKDSASFSQIKNNLFDSGLTSAFALQIDSEPSHRGVSQLGNGLGAEVSGNLSEAVALANPDAGDFHIANAGSLANNNGLCLADVRKDFDDQDRSTLDGCDIGADEI